MSDTDSGTVADSTSAPRATGPASYFPSIEKNYGRPVGEWIELVRASDIQRHMGLVDWLMADYGMGHGHANAIVAYVKANPR